MSIEREVEIYTYTLNVINLALKIKFPCKVYLEHSGSPITTEVSAASPNKFIFNQEVTLKNQTDKEYIEVLVQLVTDKGAKYVGGVLKFVEKELIGSEGQVIVVPVAKCLDSEAACEVRVEQVATSRVTKKEPARKKYHQKTQFGQDIHLKVGGGSPGKLKAHEHQTKSEFNMPLSMAYKKDRYDVRAKEPTVGGPINMKKRPDMSFERDPAQSVVGGISAIEFEVYKQGYNKLKDKYRKQAENARTELNKRMALESNQNNLKLEVMRYKLKTQELEKTLGEKNLKLKEFTQLISNFQKKELDIKYMKEEIENKNYSIKNLEETIKTLTRDNTELKNLQNLRSINEQESIKNLKDDLERVKKELELRENELSKEIKIRNDTITKKEYEIHSKSEELERAKYVIEDLEKAISNKIFEWEKIQQGDKAAAKSKQDEFKAKVAKLKEEKASLDQKIRELEQKLEEKKNETIRIEYDKKVLSQNYQSLFKEAEELKATREKYLELVREHKMVGEEKTQIEKSKQREARLKESQLEDLNQKLSQLTEANKKTIKELQEKLKSNQIKIIELQSQGEMLKNQLDKAKRQNDSLTKQNGELKNQLKDAKSDSKEKEERLLALTNQLAETKNKSKQGDYSSKLEQDRQKSQIEKLTRLLEEELAKTAGLTETVNKQELEISKSKMQCQFKEDKASKEMSYAKEKQNNLQNLKADLEAQLAAATSSIAALKTTEKGLNEKVQKLELEGIKSRQTIQKSKKEIKILEEKLQNSENNFKNKSKDHADQLEVKDGLDKEIAAKETEISHLKNELNKENNENTRNQKIVQILQGDIAKGKEEQARLNSVIKARQKTEEELRDQIKKQKEQYTKLDMKLAALKKEYEKFKETLVDNLNTTFGTIPDGSLQPGLRQSKIISTDKPVTQNSEILNLLTNLGKQARSNMNKVIDTLKASQRDRESLNSEFSSTVNKANTNEFELNQNINRLEEEISDLLAEKQSAENKYEEEIFLLEGRVREKEAVILELTQQIEELDFSFKNTKVQLEAVREESAKKEASKNKLINELREQIEYHLSSISILENSEEKLYEEINTTTAHLETTSDKANKLEKELAETKETLQVSEEDCFSLKRELKKANEKIDDLSLELSTSHEEVEKLKQSVEDEEKKAAELRQFVNGLMKQKEEIIKKQLEKSEQLLENDTKIEQMKHENQWLSEELKKYKKSEQELKETLKKTTKSLKEEEQAKTDEKGKNLKLTEKLKEKEKEILLKDEAIVRMEDKIKREKDKGTKDLKEMENQLDQTYAKLLAKEKESNEKIISLESETERQKTQIEKLKEEILNNEETIFTEKNKSENLTASLHSTEKNLNEALDEKKRLEEKVLELEEEIHLREEDNYKLQGSIFSLESRLEQKEAEKNEKLENLEEDWGCKYEGMVEEYEQRLDLVQKEKVFLKDRIEEKEREVKKLSNESKLQENNLSIIKKGFEDKIKSLQQDRLTVLGQKNTENQRLIEENRVNFESLKTKESECRKINSELELSKTTSSKLELRLKETEEKIRNLNRTYQSEVEELKKKQQTFKRLKENAASSIWKSEREVRKVIQGAIKKILDVVDQGSTAKVVEVTKLLEQNVVSAISIKLQEKEEK